MMTKVWVSLIAASFLFGALTGRMEQVSGAAVSGASNAIQLILSITGMMCLWSGLMKVMSECGLAAKIAKLLKPFLSMLFGKMSKDREAMELVSSNMTANLLGLANAATPIGLQAAARIQKNLRPKRCLP